MRKKIRINLNLAAGCLGLLLAGTVMAQLPPGQSPMGQRPTNPTTSPQNPDLNADTSMHVNVDDKKFLRDAAMGQLTEIQMGKLAADKGSTDAVKQYGQKLVDDHTKASEDIKKI